MYQYDQYDQASVRERAEQFRSQVARRLAGEITENEFKPLRLQNGLYMQLHSYMLRVAIPYGLLSSRQLRALGDIAQRYDRGYGHFTTRQNIQFNWPDLEDVPAILDDLAEVEMHAIQTSGNCVRNVTSDPFAGSAADEDVDPRPYCELLRQWSTFHPEFANLPRKFKIAVTGAKSDRAAIAFHDIGIRFEVGENAEPTAQIWVGGGQGRTPIKAVCIHENLPRTDLLSYVEAILRIYNLYGRRDNKYKARIKILVESLGGAEFKRQVEEEWVQTRDGVLKLTDEELEPYLNRFEIPVCAPDEGPEDLSALGALDPDFGRFLKNNVVEHKNDAMSIVTVTIKDHGLPPGDVTTEQMHALADLADRYAYGEVVVTHRQNLVFPHVAKSNVKTLWRGLKQLNMHQGHADRASDLICCPGLDYCSLANARSIGVAQALTTKLQAMDKALDLGPIHLNMSGCINACGHHHVGQIGILGINKLGAEYYQVSLGGDSGGDTENGPEIGSVVGRAFPREKVESAIEQILQYYADNRTAPQETFGDFYHRVGAQPFKDALYVD